MAAVASARPKGIRLRTSYRSEDQFVAAFHALVGESSLFIPTDKQLPASTECYFSVELADEAPMLRGLGVVIESWAGTNHPFKRAGVHVRVTQLTAQTEPIFERLLAAQPVANTSPRTRKAPMTQQQWGNVVEPTTEMAAAFPPEDDEPTKSGPDAEETVPAKPITREMVSASIPPANKPIAAMHASAAPVSEMDEKTTETQRYTNQLRMPAPIVLKPEPASAQMKAVSLPGVTPAKRSPTPPPQASAASLASAEPSPRPTPVPASRSSATALPPPPAFPRASASAMSPEPTSALPAPFARGSSPPATTGMATEAARPSSAPIAEAPPALADLVAATPAHESVAWGVAEPSAQPKWRVLLSRVRAWRNRTPWLHLIWWRAGAWREAWWATRKTGGMLAAGIVVGVVFTLLLRPARTIEVAAPVAMAPVQHEAVAQCPQPAAPVELADATPPAPTKATGKPAPGARPATKPTAAPPKAVAVAAAAPKPAHSAPKPAVVAPKPAITSSRPAATTTTAAVAAAKPAAATSKSSAPAVPKVATTRTPAKSAAPATRPAAAKSTKSTNVASNRPSTRNPCKASVPCI